MSPHPHPAGEVLVVDDTPASLQLLCDLLAGAGYGVRRAQDGRMALRSAQARLPDLILLDVRMPGMDGLEACRRLKADERTRDVPVIFLSALREPEDKIQGFHAGAVDYVAKPYQPDEVLARVRTHVELHRLRAGLEERVRERTQQFQKAEERLAASEARLRQLASFLQTVREEERRRIARELHDELGQALTALRIDLGWLRGKCATDAGLVQERFASALGVVEQALASLRRISEDLRPAMLDSLGLAAAVEHYVDQFTERTGLPCQLAMDREEYDLDEATATTVFRVVQEALTNVARHAGPCEVSVTITTTETELRLLISDTGRGIEGPPAAKSFGLLGMGERVNMLGGQLAIDSEPGQGVRVAAQIPLQQKATP